MHVQDFSVCEDVDQQDYDLIHDALKKFATRQPEEFVDVLRRISTDLIDDLQVETQVDRVGWARMIHFVGQLLQCQEGSIRWDEARRLLTVRAGVRRLSVDLLGNIKDGNVTCPTLYPKGVFKAASGQAPAKRAKMVKVTASDYQVDQ